MNSLTSPQWLGYRAPSGGRVTHMATGQQARKRVYVQRESSSDNLPLDGFLKAGKLSFAPGTPLASSPLRWCNTHAHWSSTHHRKAFPCIPQTGASTLVGLDPTCM